MAKAILLLRISTTRQEILTQKKELVEYALADGYKKSDLIIIEGVGASAVKLNDVYLAEIDNLYNAIENDSSINAVYSWEISRIGRNEEILMKFKNFLIDHKVQLVIKNPSLRLLNSDGSVNNGVELAFSLFATMSKQEAMVRKERFKRSKARNAAEGKYNGGKIKLGYALNETNHFIIDEEKSQIIHNVFDWYINGMSLKKIYNKLVDMGVYSSLNNFNTGGKRVAYLLKDRAYIGENYPQIISNEVFEKAQAILSDRHKWKESKNIFFCKSLIKDTLTNATLTARRNTLVYCLRHKDHTIYLNLNVMDYLAEYSANVLLAHYNAKQAQSNKAEYKLRIKENENIIAIKQTQIKEHEKVIQRAIEMNLMQPKYFGTEKMNATIKQNESVIAKLNEEIADLNTENTRMRNWLNGSQQFINTIKGVSDEKKKELIDSVIDRILVTELEKHCFKIEIKNKIGVICDSYFIYSSTGHKLHLKQIFTDERELDLTQNLTSHKRFERT